MLWRFHFASPLLCPCARITASSGLGPLNGSSGTDSLPMRSLSAIFAERFACSSPEDNARPKHVGEARKSGPSSFASSGSGVGSLGGGVSSLFRRTGVLLRLSFRLGNGVLLRFLRFAESIERAESSVRCFLHGCGGCCCGFLATFFR